MVNSQNSIEYNGQRVILVAHASELQAQVSRLVRERYIAFGLTPPADEATEWRGVTNQITLAVCRDGRVVGTLTLGIDTGGGLLADELYRPQIDERRTQGHSVGELTRLALEPGPRSTEVLALLVEVALLLAREVHGRRDIYIEVHPRHAAFYRRTMGFNIAGPEQICPRVNAPAVLLQLCLEFYAKQIDRLAGGRVRPSARCLYTMFMPRSEYGNVLQTLVIPESCAA